MVPLKSRLPNSTGKRGQGRAPVSTAVRCLVSRRCSTGSSLPHRYHVQRVQQTTGCEERVRHSNPRHIRKGSSSHRHPHRLSPRSLPFTSTTAKRIDSPRTTNSPPLPSNPKGSPPLPKVLLRSTQANHTGREDP